MRKQKDAPVRIQRKRAKGWQMPPNTVYVGRPTMWDSPFIPAECRAVGYAGSDVEIKGQCVEAFRVWLGKYWRENWDGEESRARREAILLSLHELCGKNLACWCPLDHPCHADVLLELSNK